MKKILSFLLDTLKIVVTALVIVIPVRYFLFQPFFVKGQSMEPSFESSDYLIVDEITYRFRDPQRGEVIVFKYPNDPTQRFIKRIIGLPGETVEISEGRVIIYKDGNAQVLNEYYLSEGDETSGEGRIVLGENEYFVMGDNRGVSYDSRRWGPLERKYIIGKVFLRVWPFEVYGLSQ